MFPATVSERGEEEVPVTVPRPPCARAPSRATIADVARASGVSTTTVSHVLTGKRPVAAATRERVETAVRELGYRPNHVARNLRVGSSQMIGVVVPDITNPYYGQLTRGSGRRPRVPSTAAGSATPTARLKRERRLHRRRGRPGRGRHRDLPP